jgi:hydroxypyruvate reductase
VNNIKDDARYIVERSIETVLPEKAVYDSLEGLYLPGKTFLLAIGKAA